MLNMFKYSNMIRNIFICVKKIWILVYLCEKHAYKQTHNFMKYPSSYIVAQDDSVFGTPQVIGEKSCRPWRIQASSQIFTYPEGCDMHVTMLYTLGLNKTDANSLLVNNCELISNCELWGCDWLGNRRLRVVNVPYLHKMLLVGSHNCFCSHVDA